MMTYRQPTHPEHQPIRLRELPEHETPRGRIRDCGPAALSDAELLNTRLRIGKSWATRRVPIRKRPALASPITIAGSLIGGNTLPL